MRKFFLLALVSLIWIFSSTALAFSVAHPADGIYSLQPKFAPGKELSVENHGTNWGANVIIDNINSGWRKWKVQRIAGTDFYSIIAVNSNLALDVANARAEYGVNIATWPYLDGIQNQFKFLDAGNGYYAIQANLNGSFVLDVERAENRAGANVLSWGFHGGDNQLWKLVKVQSLPTFQSYNKKATQKVTAYVMPDLQAKSGDESVSAGDNVTVLREEGNAYLVRYPVRGGTKTRWVNKNEIFKGSNDRINTQPINNINHNPQGSVERVESPSPGVLHVRGKAYDLDNARGSMRLHVYVGGGAGSGAPSYEIRTDGNSGVFDDKRQVSRTGNQRVYIYALNDYGSGNNVEIWNGYVNIQVPPFDPIWPLANSYTITTLYQYSIDGPRKGRRHGSRYYCAIDMSAPEGENVLATESGKVIASYYDTETGFGNIIKIEHDNGKVSLYAHLSARLVSKNGRVSKGQVIGKVGHTSEKYKYPKEIGNHLHFELGNSDTSGAAGDPWKEYFKPKYGNSVKLTQAAAKDPNR